MTLDQFISELATLPGKGYEAELAIYKIRLFRRGSCCCPLTAVCESVTETFYSMYEPGRAAADLGLDCGKEIVSAADKLDRCDIALRRRLLAALGLEED